MVLRTYGADHFEEQVLDGPEDLRRSSNDAAVQWLEVAGLGDTTALSSVGKLYGLHPLSLEDTLDPTQRPKVEQYETYTFVVLRALEITDRVTSHQISLFLGDGFVISVSDSDCAEFEPVRERLRGARGKIRSRGSDYLAYALIDAVVDHYFPVLESFDDYLEEVEDKVLEGSGMDPIGLARSARRDLQTIRHTVWPARDVLSSLYREEAEHVTEETRLYLRDCYDHIVQLQEMVESSREIAASLLEAYISRIGLRTNEVMKFLTILATVFIPLTFITGLYGMNFNPSTSPLNMPELSWYWGYPFSIFLMLAATAVSLYYFRRKGWFGDGAVDRDSK